MSRLSTKLLLAAFALSLGAPAAARCGGVNGHCHYRYYTPTDKERIADLSAQVSDKHRANRSLEMWLTLSIALNAVAAGIGLAALAIFMVQRKA